MDFFGLRVRNSFSAFLSACVAPSTYRWIGHIIRDLFDTFWLLDLVQKGHFEHTCRSQAKTCCSKLATTITDLLRHECIETWWEYIIARGRTPLRTRGTARGCLGLHLELWRRAWSRACFSRCYGTLRRWYIRRCGAQRPTDQLHL